MSWACLKFALHIHSDRFRLLSDWLGNVQVKPSRIKSMEKVFYLTSFCRAMVTEGNDLLECDTSHLRNASGSRRQRGRQFKTAWFSIPLHIIFWRQWNQSSIKQSERGKKQIQFASDDASSEQTFLLYATGYILKAFAPCLEGVEMCISIIFFLSQFTLKCLSFMQRALRNRQYFDIFKGYIRAFKSKIKVCN